jgi:hypothetical protein
MVRGKVHVRTQALSDHNASPKGLSSVADAASVDLIACTSGDCGGTMVRRAKSVPRAHSCAQRARTMLCPKGSGRWLMRQPD